MTTKFAWTLRSVAALLVLAFAASAKADTWQLQVGAQTGTVSRG